MPANPTQRLESLLAWGAAELSASSPSARLDAELLLAHALGKPRSYLRAHADDPAPPRDDEYRELIAARRRGTPVAHLLGEREFWSLPLEVNPATLIPRPDTEVLVERALDHLPAAQAATVLDLGTGSGAIALALASERPRAQVLGIEQSREALEIAQRNAQNLGMRNISLQAGDWFGELTAQRFDLIVSNPPYVAEQDAHLRQGDVRFEPRRALAAGPDGLDALRHIVATAPDHLQPGGWLLVEHGFDQARAVAALFESAGFEAIRNTTDYSGQPRVTEGQWPG